MLTVADVRGTNPKIWNSWKDTLFSELYQSTRRALRRGVLNPIDKEELIQGRQTQAERSLLQAGLPRERWQHIWSSFTEEYFLRHRPEEIAWHTRVLAEAANPDSIIVDVNDVVAPGLTSIAMYSREETRPFMRSTAVLDELGLTIVDARIVPLAADQRLDTYCVLESDGSPIADRRRLDEIRGRLLKALTTRQRADDQGHAARAAASADVHDAGPGRDLARPAEPAHGDRARRGRPPRAACSRSRRSSTRSASRCKNAKVATVGERAEDVFFVTTIDRQPLDDAQSESLGKALREGLADGQQ